MPHGQSAAVYTRILDGETIALRAIEDRTAEPLRYDLDVQAETVQEEPRRKKPRLPIANDGSSSGDEFVFEDELEKIWEQDGVGQYEQVHNFFTFMFSLELVVSASSRHHSQSRKGLICGIVVLQAQRFLV